MKKISYLEVASITIILTVTPLFGIITPILKESTGVNSWLPAIISYIIGIIPLLMTIYISNYRKDLNLSEKINNLFGKKVGTCLNFILSILLITLGITILYNINNFILSQFLFKTPLLISCTLFMALIIYCANKGINVISKVSLLLLLINLSLYAVNIVALIKQVDFTNFLPVLKENTNNILPTALKIACINYLPLLLLLIIPKEETTVPKKYTKAVVISYIIGAFLSLGLIIITFGVLGINLMQAFEFPEYIVLRRIKIFTALERVENIISLQWIIGSFVYLTIIVYTMARCLPFDSPKTNNWKSLVIGIILTILTINIFKNNTIFDEYIKNILPYIITSLLLIYVILIIKIMVAKRTNTEKA